MNMGLNVLAPRAQVRQMPVRFGTEYVWNHGKNAEYPLFVDIKQEQLEPAIKRIEASNKAVTDSVKAMHASMDKGFQSIVAALTASKVTAP